MMHAILLTNNELAQLRQLVANHCEAGNTLNLALSQPLPNLATFVGEINEVVSRARSASDYIDEDFPELLDALRATHAAHTAAVAARKAAS